MYDTVIVRYGEIFLKSDYVRRRFEDILTGNIKRKLARKGLDGRVYHKRNRLFIESKNPEKVCDALKEVFGIVSVSPAKAITSSMDEMADEAVKVAKKLIEPGDTFAVRVQRTGDHPYKSKDVEIKAGDLIIKALGNKVNLGGPDKTIHIEVRDGDAYVFHEKIKCLGGLPYGSQEKLIGLISTGIDSPVACWMMMRRGCKISLLHFGDKEEIKPVVKVLESFIDEEIKVYSIPHERILEKISSNADKYTCILCKRFMHKTAERTALRENAYGIVSGENIGQVASQTLENLMNVTCTKIPVYRPLVALDKEEIIEKAKTIGTYQYAKSGRCPFVPDKPATRSDEEKILELEKEAGIDELLEEVEKDYLLE